MSAVHPLLGIVRPLALTLLLFAGVHLRSLGQTAPPAPAHSNNTAEVSTHDLPATFTSRVNLVLMRVVVRDGQGRAIGTLKKEDFRLLDRGKPQFIAKFSVEKTGGNEIKPAVRDPTTEKPGEIPLPPGPDRFVAYLFDDVHLEFGDLARVRDAASRQLVESLKGNGRAAIYTTSGLISHDFTDDLASLNETLLKIRPFPRRPMRGSECPDLNFYMADLIQNRNDPMALQAVIPETISCSHMDPSSPGTRTQAEAIAQGEASRIVGIGEMETKTALAVLKDVVRRVGAMPGQRSVILVSSGFLVPIGLRMDEGDLMDRALRSNVIISALDARGLYVVTPGGDASQSGYSGAVSSRKTQYEMDGAHADAEILAELADGTGGRFVQNTNDLDAGLKRLSTPPEYYYLLAFSPQNLKYDGSYHPLKVSLPETKGFTLQARRGYYAPKHELSDPERVKEEMQEALFSREEIKDIPIDLHTQFFKSSDVSAKLAVLAHVDIARLRFLKADGRNNDTLTVLSGVFDRNGNMITGIQKTVEMRLKDQTLSTLLSRGLTVKSTFDVTPGVYVVRLVVRDSEGQTMAACNGAVEIP
jgi:VWFA-related protein